MPVNQIRVASWNLCHGRAGLDLLEAQNPALVLAQEVTAPAFTELRRRFDWGVYSLDLWGDRVREISPNKHGVAVVGSSQLDPRRCYLVEDFVAPWKMLAADLALTHHRGYFTAVSYHALNGQCGRDGFDKPRLTLQVADWLEHQPQPVVLGMDANSPMVDHPDPSKIEWSFPWLGPGSFDGRLLGPSPRHRLRDTLRTYLTAHPDEYGRRRGERPQGPLAVSYKTRGEHGVPGLHRYDHIYASWPDFRVNDVRYLYEEACAAGSDHALVAADLEADTEHGPRREVDDLLPTALLEAPIPLIAANLNTTAPLPRVSVGHRLAATSRAGAFEFAMERAPY